jgi:hypothetical protein
MRGAIEKAIFLADCDGTVTLFDTFMIVPTNYNPGQDDKEQPKNSAALDELDRYRNDIRVGPNEDDGHDAARIKCLDVLEFRIRDCDRGPTQEAPSSVLPSGKQQPQAKTVSCTHEDFEHDIKNGVRVCLGCGAEL